MLGHIDTGSGSVPDYSEPYASGRLSVGFAFTLQTTDPTRTVRVPFAVYTLRLLRICHLSGSCELYQWKYIGQSADMRRRCVAPYPTHPTRPLEHSHCRAKPTRTVRVHCEHILLWSECTGRTRRSGRSVYTGNPTRTVRERCARRVKLSSVYTALVGRRLPMIWYNGSV